jgi:hypothetical protein
MVRRFDQGLDVSLAVESASTYHLFGHYNSDHDSLFGPMVGKAPDRSND